jgi:catechol 2,3-dioxygenase-like lactoylglutathione lyase family enzyme
MLSAAVTVSALLSAAISAQGTPPAKPSTGVATVGFMHAIHATSEIEKTLAFYTEVFGVTGEIRPFQHVAVPILTDSPGVSLRVSMLRLPGRGFNFELTEFSGVPRTPAQPQIWDPGAPHMKVLVRDIEPVVAAIRKGNAPVMTTSGAPVRVTTSLGPTKAIFFRDPDGYLVEAIQVPAPGDAPEGNVIGAMMGVTVENVETAMAFWRDLLGFELTGDPNFSTDPAMLDLMGVGRGGSFRTVSGVVPGSTARIELIEFKGMSRRPFSLRVPDPGSSGMAIRVAAIADLLQRMKAKGVRVISRNGELVRWSPTVRNVFVKDPGGLNVELVGEVPAQPSCNSSAPSRHLTELRRGHALAVHAKVLSAGVSFSEPEMPSARPPS